VSAAAVIAHSRARFAITLAERGDDAELRALLRDNPMNGSMQVTFEREPDFFFIVRHSWQLPPGWCWQRPGIRGAIVGLGTRSIADAFVNGRSVPLAG